MAVDLVDETLVGEGLLDALVGQLEVAEDQRHVDAELDRGVPLGAVGWQRSAGVCGGIA